MASQSRQLADGTRLVERRHLRNGSLETRIEVHTERGYRHMYTTTLTLDSFAHCTNAQEVSDVLDEAHRHNPFC